MSAEPSPVGASSAASSPVLQLSEVAFAWPRRAGALGFQLAVAEWRVGAGERIALIGPSGGGKTTLLNLLAGVTTAQSGSVALLGQDLCALSGPRRDRFRADHVGLIFQMFNLLPYVDVGENVLLPLRFSRVRRARAAATPGGERAEAARLLTALGLEAEAFFTRPVGELSVGQQQRVAAARALIGGPELILADEPTSALDAENRESFLHLLFTEARRAGAAVIVVTHDAAVAGQFDRTVALADIATTATHYASSAAAGSAG